MSAQGKVTCPIFISWSKNGGGEGVERSTKWNEKEILLYMEHCHLADFTDGNRGQ